MLAPRSIADQCWDLYISSTNSQRPTNRFSHCSPSLLQEYFDAMLSLHRSLDLIDRHHTGSYLNELRQLIG